jgi:hypothetical protein
LLWPDSCIRVALAPLAVPNVRGPVSEQELFVGLKQEQSNKIKTLGLRLTDRDYEILKFLYDQKFCSLEMLYLRFFDHRTAAAEPIPENMPAARQRLGILKRAGLVKTEKVYSEAKSVYLLDKPGLKALHGLDPKLIYGPAIQSVDFRNFEHDTRVNLVRVALEKRGKAIKWYPERRIRIAGFVPRDLGESLPESVIPDAIFLSSKGKRRKRGPGVCGEACYSA